jgi:hypothetical protein
VQTGVVSEAEYLSLALTDRRDPAVVRERLNAALPDGIEVIVVTEDAAGLPTDRLVASEWLVALPGVSPSALAMAVQEFLALEHAEVERLTDKGKRRMDARPAVVLIEVATGAMVPAAATSAGATAADRASADRASAGSVPADGVSAGSASADSVSADSASVGNATLRMIVKHGSPAVRPDDVLTAMREVSGVTPSAPPLMTRLAQGSISESGVVMP